MTVQPIFDLYRKERLRAEALYEAGDVAQAIRAAEAIDAAQAQLALFALRGEDTISV